MWDRLKGKKTYLVMAAAIIFAWAGFATGQFDVNHAIELTLTALGASGFRNAMDKR